MQKLQLKKKILSIPNFDATRTTEAIDMAIEALERERTDEWCTDCKEYDTEKKCCPRFNKVIREAMKRVPHEDGTLEVKVEDATKIGRVLIIDDKHSGGLYYPDEDEPQGDLISRADAIRVVEKNSYRMAGLTEVKLKCEIEAVPSADRPKGKWIDIPYIPSHTKYMCSECGKAIYTNSEYIKEQKFCFSCGADMRGENK